MYPVTIDYLNAIQSNSRTSKITGLITLVDNSTIPVTNDIIAQGGLYISEQSVSGDDLDIGSVYVSEMGIGLISDMENPYSLNGARINLQYGLQLEDNSWEYVPLGLYYVYDIQRNKHIVTLKAYDGLILFDVPVVGMSGNPYHLIQNACDMAGVQLGMTQEDFAQFPNYDMELTIATGDKIKTCRDLIMWVCQLLGAFARMSRIGELEIVKHGGIGSSVRTITAGEKQQTKISDYEIQITEVTMKVGEIDYSQGTDGMTMVLSPNPLLADKTSVEINTALANVLAEVGAVQYIPFNLDITGDPAIQPGDYVAIEDTVSGLATQSGTTLTFNGTFDGAVSSCLIEGRTEQDGTPSPEEPSTPYSAGNGNLISRNADDTKSTSIALPTLRGVREVRDALEYMGDGNWLHIQRIDPAIDDCTEESIYDAWEDYALETPLETVLSLGEMGTFARKTIIEQDSALAAYITASAWVVGPGGASITTLITNSTWRYRGKHSIAGKGKNARLRSEYSQIQKAIEAVNVTANEARSLATVAQLGNELLNTAISGNILIRQEPEGRNEILIMDSTDKDQAIKIWRYNINGWGYSNNCVGADNPERVYTIMATMDGTIYATRVVAAIGTFVNLIAGVEGAQRMHMGSDEFSDPFFQMYENSGELGFKIGIYNNRVGISWPNGATIAPYAAGKLRGIGFFVE